MLRDHGYRRWGRYTADTDDDADGVKDSRMRSPDAETTDTDDDGVGTSDTDDDGDGVADGDDDYPLDASV